MRATRQLPLLTLPEAVCRQVVVIKRDMNAALHAIDRPIREPAFRFSVTGVDL
jgi:hypothetical protein